MNTFVVSLQGPIYSWWFPQYRVLHRVPNIGTFRSSTLRMLFPAAPRLCITSTLRRHHVWFRPLPVPQAYLPHIRSTHITIIHHQYQCHARSTRTPPHAHTAQTSASSRYHPNGTMAPWGQIFCTRPTVQLCTIIYRNGKSIPFLLINDRLNCNR